MTFDKDARRDFVIIYGFLMVLLSMTVNIAALSAMLYPPALTNLFIFALLMAVAAFWIGLNIFWMHHDVPYSLRFGLLILVAFIPGAYIIVVSSLLVPEPEGLIILGISVLFIGFVIGAVADLVKRMKDKKHA